LGPGDDGVEPDVLDGAAWVDLPHMKVIIMAE